MPDRTVHVIEGDAAAWGGVFQSLCAMNIKLVRHESYATLLDAPSLRPRGCVIVRVPLSPDAQRYFVQLAARMPVIVIGSNGDIATAVSVMKQDAFDYVEHSQVDHVLFSVVDAALRNEALNIEPQIAARRIAALSRREQQVFDALVRGLPNKLAAFELGLSVRTVEVHRARMMHRLGVSQLASAVRISVLATLWMGREPVALQQRGPHKGKKPSSGF